MLVMQLETAAAKLAAKQPLSELAMTELATLLEMAAKEIRRLSARATENGEP